ncbi:YbhB/YbcL family Raf kinase inhibitor-like protein [Nocardiopsis sp. YSL2]|uniref:YbhB/YbcL family Raf kinase inhibitor-like protein n=1 Tax=Nocardiopsis sp. YSL2 TaxID=2939492 RepID=UPI0026F41CFE|nr:YbhB/YbcL family Raf kinase inhibitor-like protein [Nocardiopsis sp. YSL2]
MFPALPLTRTTGARPAPRSLPGTRAGALAAGAAVALTTGCGLFTPGGEVTSDINVTSPLVQEGRALPAAYTCAADTDAPADEDGEGLTGEEDTGEEDTGEESDEGAAGEEAEETVEGTSPPLNWSGLPDPDSVGSIAVVVDDPQAAEVFWVLFDVDPQLGGIRQGTVPPDARQAQNSAGGTGYLPPCPEEGDPHEYRFTVYALSGTLDLPDGSELSRTLEAIADSAIARGTLTTTSE